MATKEQLIKALAKIRSPKTELEEFHEITSRMKGPLEKGISLIGNLGRGAAKGIGAVPDIAALPYNIIQSYRGKEGIPSASEKLGDLYDLVTQGKYQPTNLPGRIAQGGGEFLTGGLGIGKAAGAISKKAAKYLEPKTDLDVASLISAGGGSELGRELSNESPYGALAGGLLGGVVPGVATSLVGALKPNRSGVETFENIAGIPYQGKGEHIHPVVERLGQRAVEERKPIEQAYEIATGRAAETPKENFKGFAEDIAQRLERESIYPADSKEISSFLKTLKTIQEKETIPMNRLEKRRQVLNNLIEKSEEGGTRSLSLRTLKRNFDDALDDRVQFALENSNNPEYAKVLEEFKHARKLNHDWSQKYHTENPKDFGKAFVSDMVDRARTNKDSLTPESIANRLFGFSEIGFQDKTPYIVRELSKHLSPEDLNAIKYEAVGRILKPVNKENFTVSDASKFKKNWDQVKSENHTLVDELLGKKTISQIDEFANNIRKTKLPAAFKQEVDKLPFVGKAFEYSYSGLAKSPIILAPTITSSISHQKQEPSREDLIEQLMNLRSNSGL
jgi:hypothetical protein